MHRGTKHCSPSHLYSRASCTFHTLTQFQRQIFTRPMFQNFEFEILCTHRQKNAMPYSFTRLHDLCQLSAPHILRTTHLEYTPINMIYMSVIIYQDLTLCNIPCNYHNYACTVNRRAAKTSHSAKENRTLYTHTYINIEGCKSELKKSHTHCN